MFKFIKRLFKREKEFTTLNEAVKFLYSDDEFMSVLENAEDWEELIGFGRWIRNYMKLWVKDSKLRNFFLRRGIWHPDDMSAIILKVAFRSYSNIPTNFIKEVEFYNKYWSHEKITKEEILETLSEVEKIVYIMNIDGKDEKWLK